MLAAVSAVASDLPPWAAWPLAVVIAVHGLWLARTESRRPVRSVVVAPDGGATRIDGVAVDSFIVHWRGPLAFAHWRDGHGRTQRLAWWPDTLPRAARRELRLAVAAPASAHAARSVAP